MSIYLAVGESESEFFSSNTGWVNVVNWAESLHDDFDAVKHLVEHGFTDDAEELSKQLTAALEVKPPSADIAATIKEALLLLGGESGEVIVDSGMEAINNED